MSERLDAHLATWKFLYYAALNWNTISQSIHDFYESNIVILTIVMSLLIGAGATLCRKGQSRVARHAKPLCWQFMRYGLKSMVCAYSTDVCSKIKQP